MAFHSRIPSLFLPKTFFPSLQTKPTLPFTFTFSSRAFSCFTRSIHSSGTHVFGGFIPVLPVLGRVLFSSVMSPRESMISRELAAITHPESKLDIVYSGFVTQLEVKELGVVVITLKLDKHYAELKRQILEKVGKLDFVKSVRVKMDTPARPTMSTGKNTSKNGLERVKHIIAVSSCKGGVGKSTVAVNLAFTLAKKYQVGIYDADIYGPSLPTLVSAKGDVVEVEHENVRLLSPLVYENVKLMSYGFVKQQAAVMRGPMVSNVVSQLIKFTDWGELDYLVVDMPPGTGDIIITLSQQLPFSAAVTVSTPQKMSFIDVEKGIDMFSKVNVPTVAFVENMSSFICPSCSVAHPLFPSYTSTVSLGVPTFKLPMLPSLSNHSDAGDPFVLHSSPEGAAVRSVFDDLAEQVVKSSVNKVVVPEPIFSYDENKKTIFVQANEKSFELSASLVRKSCRCAECIDEMTNVSRLRPSDLAAMEKAYPVSMKKMGNYALSITWSDKHASIFPYKQFESMK